MSIAWRIRAHTSQEVWKWDIKGLRLGDSSGVECLPTAGICSGSASDVEHGGHGGWSVHGMLFDRGPWGGRPDAEGLWVGAGFAQPVEVRFVDFEALGEQHAVSLERQNSDSIWEVVCMLDESTRFPSPAPEQLHPLPQLMSFSAPEQPPNASVEDPRSTVWRIRAHIPQESWKWDVKGLQFYDACGKLCRPVATHSSGSASDKLHGGHGGWSAHDMFEHGGCWGGRPDATGSLWVGAEFEELVEITNVDYEDEGGQFCVVLERRCCDGFWEHVRMLSGSMELGDEDGTIFVSRPSQPIRKRIQDVAYRHLLQPPGQFSPDPGFYYSENCEGLWVCVSKSCGPEILARACHLVRCVVRPEMRALWGLFRAPKGFKDPGPMRLVVLDNRSNEDHIPELGDEQTGRNGTACPFVFTSREDFAEGVTSWRPGMLTLHEMTHGMDMVAIQQHDPSFDEEVEVLYEQHMPQFLYSEGGYRKKCYAATNRAEFLAECHVIMQDIMQNDEVRACGLERASQLEEKMPEVVALLRRYFSAPLDPSYSEDWR